MARIQTYSSDQKVSGNDSWIGTDGDNYSQTKNFSPNRVADYLNSSEKIDRASTITYTYQTLNPGESRSYGTISFDGVQPVYKAFSEISEILISKRSNGLKYVDEFLSGTDETTIILQRSNSVNSYGLYNVTSINEYIDDSNFFVFTLEFIQGNGGLEEDKDYLFNVADFSQGGVSIHNELEGLNDGDYIHLTQEEKDKFDSLPNTFASKTSDLTNDGADGTSTYVETDELGATAFSNDYNDLDNLPTIPEAVTKTSDLLNDGDDGVNPFITLEDIPPVDISGLVPYTGATQNVDLGEYQIKAGQIELDQTPTQTFNVGCMRWNDADGTAEIKLKGGNVILQVGQEQLVRVVNKVGSNLLESNYQAVRITGAQGQRLKVGLAQATNDLLSAETIGLVTENIDNNQEGFVTTSGLVREINTTGSLQGETWNDGDILYLSTTTAGRITNIKPTAPSHLIIIGYVVYSHSQHGSIFVKVDNGYELEELHNVTSTNYTTPINTDSVLTFDVTTSLWKRLSWLNVKSNLKTYFDTIYTTTSAVASQISSALVGYATQSWVTSQGYITNVITALGYTPENVANKSTSTLDSASSMKFPVWSAVVSYVTSALSSFKTTNFLDATSSIQTQLNSKLYKSATPNSVYATDGSGNQEMVLKSSLIDNNFYDLYKRHMFYYSTGGTAGSPLQISISVNESPTGTNVNGSNNVFARNITSTATAGSSGEIRESSFGRILPNKKFYFDTYISNRNAISVSTERYFYGLTSGVSAFGNIDISAINSSVSLLGIGCDTADVNIHLFHRIEGGVINKIDLGFNKTLNHDFRIVLYKTPSSSDVYYSVKNITTGVTQSGNFSFANTGNLNPRYHKNNGVTASAVTFGLNGFKIFIED